MGSTSSPKHGREQRGEEGEERQMVVAKERGGKARGGWKAGRIVKVQRGERWEKVKDTVQERWRERGRGERKCAGGYH